MKLTKTQFLVLASLARHAMHAYAMRGEISELTDHRYSPSGSTLRRTIEALVEKGLIEECSSNPNYWLKANRGIPYELTPQGRHQLERETAAYFKACQIIRMHSQPPAPFRSRTYGRPAE